MLVNTIHQETMTVKSSETDFRQQLKLSNLFLWLQDAGADHADRLGWGFHDLAAKDYAWVLSRIKVRCFDFPHLGDSVTVQTWPKGIHQKVFFMRDYLLTAEDGRQIAAATSAYLVINAQTRRMMLPGALDLTMPDNDGRSAIDEPLEHIAPVEPLRDCYTVHVGYSMVDVLGHVNNSRYIDWITDCFSMEEHEAHCLSWLQINYLNEVKPGESVRLERGERPGQPSSAYVTGMNQTTGAKAFEAEMGWDQDAGDVAPDDSTQPAG